MQQEINIISEKLQSIWKKLYIVWWFCREKILWNSNSWDIDLVTDATPEEFEKVLNIVWEVWKKYWTCIVKEWNKSYEITTFRKDIWTINFRKPAEVIFTTDLKQDAKRRDFTCNSIYFDVKNKVFIDPNDWIKDIKNSILRFVWDPKNRINEDILRILRAIRFKNKYNFNFALNDYYSIFKENINILKNLPIERIKQELDKILFDKNNVQSLKDLNDIWFLDLYLKEVSDLENIPWNKHHLEWNVLIHTFMCLEEMNNIILNLNYSDELKLDLLWAILLHDIWKKEALSFSEKDLDNHYFLHDDIWAEKFKLDISNRLYFSNNSKNIIYYLIKNHIKIFHIPEMKKLKARKFMMEKYFPYLLILARADSLGKIPKSEKRINDIEKIYNNFQNILKSKKFFNGDDIIKKYPDLIWRQIWDKLKVLNDIILIED